MQSHFRTYVHSLKSKTLRVRKFKYLAPEIFWPTFAEEDIHSSPNGSIYFPLILKLGITEPLAVN